MAAARIVEKLLEVCALSVAPAERWGEKKAAPGTNRTRLHGDKKSADAYRISDA
jgi:hypothetical protein